MGEEGVAVEDQTSLVAKLVRFVIASAIVYGIAIGMSIAADGPEDPFIGGGLTVVQVTALLSFAINSAAFVPAFIFQTEKFYDLTGAITYLSCIAYSYFAGQEVYGNEVRPRAIVASILVCVWSIRLGLFLFLRVLGAGKDDRFDVIKPNPFRFFVAWSLQALWVFLTAYAVFVTNASANTDQLGVVEVIGLVLWAIFFGIEIIADRQKTVWRRDPANKGKFIEYGLWYYSRHPNYFGEIFLWTGMFVICSPTFEGSQWAAVVSPIFIFCLIYFISGVKMLEDKADKKWGGQEDYENYKATTSVLFILPKLGERKQDLSQA